MKIVYSILALVLAIFLVYFFRSTITFLGLLSIFLIFFITIFFQYKSNFFLIIPTIIFTLIVLEVFLLNYNHLIKIVNFIQLDKNSEIENHSKNENNINIDDNKKIENNKKKQKKKNKPILQGDYGIKNYMKLGGTLGYYPNCKQLNDYDFSSTKILNDKIIYDVMYNFDKNCLRNTGNKNNNGSKILFFGGSFAFGEGLNDQDTIPFLINESLNFQYQVFNYGFHGYGPRQFVRILETENFKDQKSQKKLKFVYIYIPAHNGRIYCNENWGDNAPKYKLYNNKIKYVGPCMNYYFSIFYKRSKLLKFSYDNIIKLKNNFFKKNKPKTIDFFIYANEIIEKKFNSELLIVNYSQTKMGNNFLTSNLNILDASNNLQKYDENKLYILNDGHPTGFANKIIADLILKEL